MDNKKEFLEKYKPLSARVFGHQYENFPNRVVVSGLENEFMDLVAPFTSPRTSGSFAGVEVSDDQISLDARRALIAFDRDLVKKRLREMGIEDSDLAIRQALKQILDGVQLKSKPKNPADRLPGLSPVEAFLVDQWITRAGRLHWSGNCSSFLDQVVLDMGDKYHMGRDEFYRLLRKLGKQGFLIKEGRNWRYPPA